MLDHVRRERDTGQDVRRPIHGDDDRQQPAPKQIMRPRPANERAPAVSGLLRSRCRAAA